MKSSTLTDIAPEILDIIFTNLDTRDALQCQLVCGKWSKVAQEHVYKDTEAFS